MQSSQTEAQVKYDALISWISDNAISGGEFIKAQAPDIAQQAINWGLYSTGLLATLFLILSLLLLAWAIWCAKQINRGSGDGDFHMMGVVFCGAVGLGFSIAFIVSIYNFCFIYCAPKLYLLHELSRLV